jgi:hypothetical protein
MNSIGLSVLAVFAGSLAWSFRAFLVLLLVFEAWELAYPERSRQWNLKLYEWRPWIASTRLRESMRNASSQRLRIRTALVMIYATLLLLISFKVLR